MGDEIKKEGDQGDLAETKRIMERLVRTPPKPHKPSRDKKSGGIDDDDGTPDR